MEDLTGMAINTSQIFVSIDKTKGIVCKPMPKYWYDYHAALETPGEDDINIRIVASRKPRFMTYIYPLLMKEYKAFVKGTNLKSIMEFGVPVDELLSIPEAQRTERQKEFLEYRGALATVGTNKCTMNRLCAIVEKQVADIKTASADVDFDYSIMKTEAEYKRSQYYAVKELYDEHTAKLQYVATQMRNKELSRDAYSDYRTTIIQRFRRDAECLCSNQNQLCNIVLDMCYKKQTSKQFVWDVVPQALIDNLRARAGSIMIRYPRRDPDGDIEYCGERFSMHECEDEFIWI